MFSTYESSKQSLYDYTFRIHRLYSTCSVSLLLWLLDKRTSLYQNDIYSADTEEDRSSQKKKLVVTFVLATAGFVIGYGPTMVFYTVIVAEGDEQIDVKLYSDLPRVLHFVFFCSLCLNPILYDFRSTNFQEGFKRIIFCRKPTPQEEIHLG